MKTRAINNSVREWAKRFTGKVKSIVNWIRVGVKNNKESIDRIEERLRDYYQHKAHKKPRKKTRRRDSTVYSTMRLTALCGFMSLKDDLY